MNIAICDDEALFRKILYENLTKYSVDFGYNFNIYEYSDGSDLLCTEIVFDLIFMDYQMKSINGMDTMSSIRKRKDKTKVIFISSYKDIVFESMKVNTFRFLVKPLDKEKFYEALNSEIKEISEIIKIVVKDIENQKNVTIMESEIIYIQADNIYSTVITENAVYKYSGSIKELLENLKGDFFYRTNRSYIVNFNFISNFNNKEITLSNGHKALISKLKLKDFKNRYFAYLRRKSIGE